MSSIRLQGVSFAWPSGTVIVDDANVHFPRGFTAIVGANGAGKSTLLRLVTGDLPPDRGKILRDPPGMTVGWLSQSDFGDASPGELRRARLGEVLRDRPDVLILDEPSNHLDTEARRWLIGALRRYDGIGLLVSHDRELMQAVAPRTVRIDAGRVTEYALPYAAAREAWMAELRRAWEARDQAQDRVRKAAKQLGDARRDRASAERQRSASNRMRDRNDNDGRGSLAKGLAAIGEQSQGKRVHAARTELLRASSALSSAEVPTELGRDIELGYRPSARSRVATFQGDLLGRSMEVGVDRHSRIWLQGPNGSGKSTLLRALAANAPDALHLPQVLDAAAGRADLEAVRELTPDARGRVMSHLAALGADPGRVLHSGQPSPGEARKLRLALGLGSEFAALFLDEPTNDLDLPAIERLETALSGWPGALVLITHDRQLGEALVPDEPGRPDRRRVDLAR